MAMNYNEPTDGFTNKALESTASASSFEIIFLWKNSSIPRAILFFSIGQGSHFVVHEVPAGQYMDSNDSKQQGNTSLVQLVALPLLLVVSKFLEEPIGVPESLTCVPGLSQALRGGQVFQVAQLSQHRSKPLRPSASRRSCAPSWRQATSHQCQYLGSAGQCLPCASKVGVGDAAGPAAAATAPSSGQGLAEPAMPPRGSAETLSLTVTNGPAAGDGAAKSMLLPPPHQRQPQ